MKHNTNCLDGMACPKCKSEGPFKIWITRCVQIYVSDEGVYDESGGDSEWEEGDTTECLECHHVGTVETFTLPIEAEALNAC